MSEWKPIQTAPESTRILLWNAAVGAYSSELIDGEWPLFIWNGMRGTWYPKPSHWMPLPAAPVTP